MSVPAPLDPLDWFARWRAMVRRREAQVEALTDRPPPEDYWGRRATCFHQQTRAAQDAVPDPFLTLVLARVDGASVLDVGAGTGRHTLPLARRARRVRALEPSAAMRGFLEEEIAARRLTNVEVIARAWPADGIEAADVVICAHVLYPIAELEPFLRGLDEAARRACFLLLRSDGFPVWEGYWRRVRGQDRLWEPGLVEAYNACCQIGLRPNVTMFEAETTMEWRSAEEALRDLATRLFMAESSPLYPRLREVVTQDLHPTEGGCGIGPYRARLGVLWWEKPLGGMANEDSD